MKDIETVNFSDLNENAKNIIVSTAKYDAITLNTNADFRIDGKKLDDYIGFESDTYYDIIRSFEDEMTSIEFKNIAFRFPGDGDDISFYYKLTDIPGLEGLICIGLYNDYNSIGKFINADIHEEPENEIFIESIFEFDKITPNTIKQSVLSQIDNSIVPENVSSAIITALNTLIRKTEKIIDKYETIVESNELQIVKELLEGHLVDVDADTLELIEIVD